MANLAPQSLSRPVMHWASRALGPQELLHADHGVTIQRQVEFKKHAIASTGFWPGHRPFTPHETSLRLMPVPQVMLQLPQAEVSHAQVEVSRHVCQVDGLLPSHSSGFSPLHVTVRSCLPVPQLVLHVVQSPISQLQPSGLIQERTVLGIVPGQSC